MLPVYACRLPSHSMEFTYFTGLHVALQHMFAFHRLAFAMYHSPLFTLIYLSTFFALPFCLSTVLPVGSA